MATNFPGSVTASNSGNFYKTDLRSGAFNLVADEPVEYGGQAIGPAPVDYLCMALASCKAITIRMYVQRKGWKLETVEVKAGFVKGSDTPLALNTFFCEVSLAGDLTDEQRGRILQIAKACPIEKLLSKANEVVTIIV